MRMTKVSIVTLFTVIAASIICCNNANAWGRGWRTYQQTQGQQTVGSCPTCSGGQCRLSQQTTVVQQQTDTTTVTQIPSVISTEEAPVEVKRLPQSVEETGVTAETNSILSAEEQAALDYCNELRARSGLAPLTVDPALVAAAREHSNDMRTHRFFSHYSLLPFKRTWMERAARAGSSASTENIAMGLHSGRSTVSMWWNSPGHRANMLSRSTRCGIGHVNGYWTFMFGN